MEKNTRIKRALKMILKVLRYYFLLFMVILLIGFILTKIDKNNLEQDCFKSGILSRYHFRLKTKEFLDFKGAKAKSFKKQSEFKIVLDSTTVENITSDYYNAIKSFEMDSLCSFKFSKPISTNQDWMIMLRNGTTLKITNIENEIVCYPVLFNEDCYCKIFALKINDVESRKYNEYSKISENYPNDSTSEFFYN